MLIIKYARAEIDGDRSLHLHACYKVIPYFVAASHVKYFRYSLCYLRTMHKSLGIVLEKILKGEHVVHHQDEHWNRIWTDMMIEKICMRHGIGPGGIIGTTTKPRPVRVWSNTLPSYNDLLRDLDELTGKYPAQKIIHKEEWQE